MHDHVGTWKKRKVDGPVFMPGFELEIDAAALVIVDLQNYSTHPDVGWAPVMRNNYPEIAKYFLTRMTEVVLPNTCRLLDACRTNGVRVLYLTVGPELPDGADFLPQRHSTAVSVESQYGQKTIPHRGTFEHEVAKILAPRDTEIVLNKVTRSAFASTGIDQILRNLGVSQLVFCGTATDSCVETTARDASDRGYQCVLIDDACVTIGQDGHDSTLLAFDRFFGMVKTTEELCHILPRR